ncbi:hypothetical protein [Actinoplanes sp. NPDC089786]|uniref:hypothetical protein n=1 Tax=Actinoplanes sp. NPDC089786 TaxID=3155185 RepID=UPI00341BC8D3
MAVFTNVVSDAAGLKALAISAVTACSFAAAWWLRQRPRALIAQYSLRFALCLLLIGSLTASMMSSTAAGIATAISVIIGAATVATQRDLTKAIHLLLRMIMAGLLAGSLGSGLKLVINGQQPAGTWLIIVGVSSVAMAAFVDRLMTRTTERWTWDQSLIIRMPRYFSSMIFALGQVMFFVGASSGLAGQPLAAAALALQGAFVSLMGLAQTSRSEALAIASVIGTSLSIVGIGIWFLTAGENILWGTLGLIIGMATLGLIVGRGVPLAARVRLRLISISREPDDVAPASVSSHR